MNQNLHFSPPFELLAVQLIAFRLSFVLLKEHLNVIVNENEKKNENETEIEMKKEMNAKEWKKTKKMLKQSENENENENEKNAKNEMKKNVLYEFLLFVLHVQNAEKKQKQKQKMNHVMLVLSAFSLIFSDCVLIWQKERKTRKKLKENEIENEN